MQRLIILARQASRDMAMCEAQKVHEQESLPLLISTHQLLYPCTSLPMSVLAHSTIYGGAEYTRVEPAWWEW